MGWSIGNGVRHLKKTLLQDVFLTSTWYSNLGCYFIPGIVSDFFSAVSWQVVVVQTRVIFDSPYQSHVYSVVVHVCDKMGATERQRCRLTRYAARLSCLVGRRNVGDMTRRSVIRSLVVAMTQVIRRLLGKHGMRSCVVG